MTMRFTTTMRNNLTNLVVDALDAGAGAGTVQVRTGSQPASAGDAATGTLLATVTLADPAFGASANGTATATDPAAVNAVATGTAGWFRALDSNAVVVMDGSVTATGGGGDMEVSTTAIVSGTPFDITGWSVTAPGA